MNDILITLVLVASIALIHFAYVDFRFRYRDGMQWYWMLNPAPALMWIGRGFFVAAVGFALCLHFFSDKAMFFWILGGLLVAHLVSMMLLELLEPR